jgi:hypothetical protein
MSQFELLYTYIHTYIHTYTWKCHKETPCVATETKMENRRAEQVLFGRLITVRGVRRREKGVRR